MIAIKILAILGVIVGIYFFIEEQLDINLNSSKMEGKDNNNSNGGYLESVTGASLDEQLIEVLLMISSCLKAGRNLDQAFELVAVSTPPPICNEFRTLVQERRLGVPMVEALTNLANRVPSQDLRLAVNATIFQQETGGNLEDLYTQILLTISERKKIMGKIVAGTAHARLSGNMVATIPVILAIILWSMQPDYLLPMLKNPYGQIALLLAIAATVIGVVFINRMTTSILPDAEEAMISKNDSNTRNSKKYKLLKVILNPFMIFMGALPSNLTNKLKNETKFLLNASGKSDVFSVSEYIGLMALSTIVFGLIMLLLLNPAYMGIWAWFVLIALLPIGFRLPRIYLAHLIRKRQKNIEFELPYVIDLLSLAIESGLDLTGGIAKVVEKSRNTDIIVEFKMFLADIKVGKSMEEALADMAERVKVLSFFSFVSSLIQAQRLGADIGPTLRAQAEQMRYQRLILAEERVNKLPVKLLIPLVFFVFPSISVLLIGPAMIQIQTKFPKPNTVKSKQVKKENTNKLVVEKKEVSKEKVSVTTPSNALPEKSEPKTSNNFSKSNTMIENKTKVEKPVVINEEAPIIINDNTKPTVVETMPVVPTVIPAPIIITEPADNNEKDTNEAGQEKNLIDSDNSENTNNSTSNNNSNIDNAVIELKIGDSIIIDSEGEKVVVEEKHYEVGSDSLDIEATEIEKKEIVPIKIEENVNGTNKMIPIEIILDK